jgi:hypothetical protein
MIIDNVIFHMEIGVDLDNDNQVLDLVAWNMLKLYDFEEIDEIRTLMDDEELKRKLADIISDAGGFWWSRSPYAVRSFA